MTTIGPPELKRLAVLYDKLSDYPSAVFSGIVGDAAHMARGGFHVSIQDLFKYGNDGDFSNRRTGDTAPPVVSKTYAAGLDMSMSAADMRKHYTRVMKLYNNKNDPRRKYLNAVNTWSGTGNPVRIDFRANTITTASADHKYHNHTEWTRIYVDDVYNLLQTRKAMRAYLSVLQDQSVEEWLEQEEGDMASGGYINLRKGDGSTPTTKHLQTNVKGLQNMLRRSGHLKANTENETFYKPGEYDDPTAAAVVAARQSQGSSATDGSEISGDADVQIRCAVIDKMIKNALAALPTGPGIQEDSVVSIEGEDFHVVGTISSVPEEPSA